MKFAITRTFFVASCTLWFVAGFPLWGAHTTTSSASSAPHLQHHAISDDNPVSPTPTSDEGQSTAAPNPEQYAGKPPLPLMPVPSYQVEDEEGNFGNKSIISTVLAETGYEGDIKEEKIEAEFDTPHLLRPPDMHSHSIWNVTDLRHNITHSGHKMHGGGPLGPHWPGHKYTGNQTGQTNATAANNESTADAEEWADVETVEFGGMPHLPPPSVLSEHGAEEKGFNASESVGDETSILGTGYNRRADKDSL
ncbi:hypothetical protein BDQ12DRAFT_677311 [Crucibulum laeve]|uniref:Uncharacterized protein n=1 Tax=Crucibulum laeve TaxID=68775 RepID=A0A5C3MBP8_9AGAR|nr:hypothetical protein BDQ12DRAFT_677311 [Crucibulum laeve]